jgi:hypothetical protein
MIEKLNRAAQIVNSANKDKRPPLDENDNHLAIKGLLIHIPVSAACLVAGMGYPRRRQKKTERRLLYGNLCFIA